MDTNFKTDFDNLPEESKKEVLNKLLFEKIRTQTLQRLQTDKALQDYFSQFNKHSVDFGWKMYAIKKAKWMTSPESLEKSSDYVDMKYANAANAALALILKRKAMQKIAEWNAYEKDFEGIEVSIDFALWGADIFNIPHIESIERQEIDIYVKYLNRLSDEEELEHIFLPTSYFIQRHAAGLNNDEDADNDFTTLYNTLKGAGTYLILPPKKTDIEKSYENALRNHRVKEHEQEIASGKKEKYIPDTRPYALISNRNTYEFVKRFEDAEVLRKYRVYARFNEDDVKESDQLEEEEELEWNIKNMLRENAPIPIEAHEDFREALKKSFYAFEKRKTIAAIETAYEDYCFRIKNKMSFERNEEKIAQALDWIRRTKEYLIEARVFAGKPADLNMF